MEKGPVGEGREGKQNDSRKVDGHDQLAMYACMEIPQRYHQFVWLIF
jgi:hypothetical protein